MEACRTLLVEDDRDTADAISRILRRRGYQIDTASTVGEAVGKLEENPVCVILDLMLPDGSGIDVLRRIRERNLPVRVAIATGAADTNLMSDAILLKPDAFFTKPIDATELVGWLGSERKHDPLC